MLLMPMLQSRDHTLSSHILQMISRPPFKVPKSLCWSLSTTATSSPIFFFFAFNASATLNGQWPSKTPWSFAPLCLYTVSSIHFACPPAEVYQLTPTQLTSILASLSLSQTMDPCKRILVHIQGSKPGEYPGPEAQVPKV